MPINLTSIGHFWPPVLKKVINSNRNMYRKGLVDSAETLLPERRIKQQGLFHLDQREDLNDLSKHTRRINTRGGEKLKDNDDRRYRYTFRQKIRKKL